MDKSKFEFPAKGFHIVTDKVSEADFFLEMMKENSGFDNFKYFFSAFISATRSITFSMQAVMSKYPGFKEWYPPRQETLRNNKLAKLFLHLRNHSQKVGDIPIFQSAKFKKGRLEHLAYLIPNRDFPEVPEEDLISLSHSYFCAILGIVKELYSDFRIYVDPRMIFTTDGLNQLGWSIDDLEESLGFPRGWTNSTWEHADKDQQRLHALRHYGGDEEAEHFFSKYNIDTNPNGTNALHNTDKHSQSSTPSDSILDSVIHNLLSRLRNNRD